MRAKNPAEKTDEMRGLEWRHCGWKHFRVLYTRAGSGGKLIRRRECATVAAE